MSQLDDVLARLGAMPEAERAKLVEVATSTVGDAKFIPSPGPQTDAWFSKADVLLYGGQAGGGKEQDVDAKVLTPWGWKRIGDLKVGSRICAVDGTVTEVIAVRPQGVKDIYRVTMADGGLTLAGLDHLWLAWDVSKSRKIGNESTHGGASARKYTTRQMIEVMARDGADGETRRHRLAIPVTKPVALNVAGGCVGPGNFVGREVEPYLLGLLLGDGCIRTRKAEITTNDGEIVDFVTGYAGDDVRVSKRGDNYALSLRGDTLRDVKSGLARMGIDGKGAWEKSIPRQYLFGPTDVRWAVLQGLMDTDGWAEPKRACYFTSVSEDLARGVEHLARSLGGVTSWSIKSPTYSGHDGEKLDGRTAFTVRIKMQNPDQLFRLVRKKEIAAGINHQSHGRFIEAIEFSHRAEAVCIEVAHPSSLYITDDFIVTHNSGLLAGIALEQHRRSLIVRREAADLSPIIDEVLKFHGTRDGFNGAPPQKLRWTEGGVEKVIKFGGVRQPGDWEKYQGDPRDFLGVDEAAQFLEIQIRMLMAWVRTDVRGQRTRTILASNPPVTSVGDWMIGMFRPWLDMTHPNPAEHGELRWFVTDPDGHDMEVDGPEPVQFPGRDEPAYPKSRTFIPAALSDNPFLTHDTQYQGQLDTLPEPMRSAFRDGNFMLARQDDEFQVIPTQWIREAQSRWTPEPPEHAPMSCMAVDIAQGGADNTIIAKRYDAWFAPLEVYPGAETPTGNEVAGLVISQRRNGCAIVLDMGGGYGGAAKMRLEDNGVEGIVAYKGANATGKRTADQQFGFFNTRAMAYWRLREALDPSQDGGAVIALPDDPELVSDLTALRFEITGKGVKVTPKDKVVELLGRSPDRGDAVAMANLHGPKLMTHGNQWRKYSKENGTGRKPVSVNMGHMAARRRR